MVEIREAGPIRTSPAREASAIIVADFPGLSLHFAESIDALACPAMRGAAIPVEEAEAEAETTESETVETADDAGVLARHPRTRHLDVVCSPATDRDRRGADAEVGIELLLQGDPGDGHRFAQVVEAHALLA